MLHSKFHILFLENNTFQLKNKYELQANKFAAELLISDDIIKECPEYYTLDQIASSQQLPVELLKLKFEIE